VRPALQNKKGLNADEGGCTQNTQMVQSGSQAVDLRALIGPSRNLAPSADGSFSLPLYACISVHLLISAFKIFLFDAANNQRP